MKITKENGFAMAIQESNYFVYFVGFIFAGAGFTAIVKPDFFVSKPSLWLALFGIALGSFITLSNKTITVSLDKNSGKAIFKQKSAFGSESKEYNIDSIKQVEIRRGYSGSRDRGGYTYHLFFITNSGESIPLNPGATGSKRGWFQKIPEIDVGKRISLFLNVPFVEITPSFDKILDTVKSALQDAVKDRTEEGKGA